MEEYADKYDAEYYQYYLGERPYEDPFWEKGFETMGGLITEAFHPSSSLEIGCAMGYLVTALRKQGVEAYGIDISDYAISKVAPETAQFCKVYSALDGLPDYFPKRYDLVICIEVAEHLYPEDGRQLIRNLCSYADSVLFSSTPDDVYEITHHNVQPAAYWAKLFAEQGFYQDFANRPSYVSPQALLFRKERDIPQVICRYEETLEQNRAEHTKSFLALLEDRKKAQAVMDAQNQEVQRLQEDVHVLREDRMEAQKVMDAQDREVERLQKSFSALQADRAEAQKIMDAQQGKLERLQMDFSALQADRTEAQTVMDEQQEEVNCLRESLASLRTDHAEAQKIMDAQQGKLERLQMDFSALQADRAEAQKIMDAQQGKLERLQMDFSALQADRAEAQKVMDEQQEALEQRGIVKKFVRFFEKIRHFGGKNGK